LVNECADMLARRGVIGGSDRPQLVVPNSEDTDRTDHVMTDG
jgi:hypothetical protein